MARIVEFEGRRIEVPDDATDAEVGSILSAQPAAPQVAAPAPSPTPAAPSLTDTIMGGLNYAGETIAQGARGVRKGVSNVAGLPVDIVNNTPRLLNVLPGVDGVGAISERPFMGSEYVDRALGGFGTVPEPPPPSGFVQRSARRVGEEVGAAAVPGAGALAAAGRVGVQGARELPYLARMFVEPAAVAPGAFAAKEGAMAVGAGQGAAIANEAVDPSTARGQAADVGGALAGAAVTGIGGSVLRSTSDLLRAIFGSKTYVDDVVREAVTDRIAANAGLQTAPGAPVDTTALVEAIQRGPRIGQDVPGIVESLADRTRNPGIAALEYARQSGPNSGLFAQRRADNATAVDTAISAGQPQGNPGAFSSELDLERTRRLTEANVLAENAQREAARAAQPLTPQGTPATRGDTVRGALEASRETARQATEDAYSTAATNNVAADPARLTAALDETMAGLTQTERGLVPQGLVDRVRALGQGPEGGAPVATGVLDAEGRPVTRAPEPPEPVRLKEATDLRSELQRLQRAAVADPRAENGGRNAARVLGDLETVVDDFIFQSLPPEQQAALRTARETKYGEVERFGRPGDPVAQSLARYPGGQPKMRDENVARTFTNPQNLNRLLTEADTPAVRTAIRNEMLAGADTSSEAGIRQFMQGNQEALARFPGLMQELEAAARARGTEATATTAASELTDTLTRQGRSNVANYLSYGDENADRAMRSVLAAREPSKAIDELLAFVNDDPKAVEGARRVFWDIMEKSSRRAGETTSNINGAQPWMPKALQRFVDDPRNAAVAERLYRDNPEHWANVKKIVGVIQGLDVRNSGKVPNTSGTAQSMLPSAETMNSRLFAYQRGQVGAGWLISSLAAMAGRRAVKAARSSAIERMLDEALLNPDAAALLLKENNPANRAALARSARGYLGNEASTIVNMLSAEEKDETKDAVMRNGR